MHRVPNAVGSPSMVERVVVYAAFVFILLALFLEQSPSYVIGP